MTLPLATLTNVGRTSRTEQLYLEGQNDLLGETLEMTLWSQGGSVLQAESGLSIRNEGGKTFARRGGGEWQEIDDFTGALAPQGDFMAYLAAIKDVQAHPAEERGGVRFTRYSFAIDSPALAAYLHKQMEASMRARGAPIGPPPPGLHLEAPALFRDMVGSGELWVGEEGLPLRQILTLQFPEQKDEQVHAQIVVDFSRYGTPQVGPLALLRAGDLPGLWQSLPAMLPDLAPLWVMLPLLALGALIVYYRRARLLYNSVAVAVIASLVAGPVLTTITQVRFFDTQSAKAAAQEERQAAADQEREIREVLGTVEFNPHLNPLETERLRDWGDSSIQSPQSLDLQFPNLQTTDDGTDTDGDGLSDFVEERIGTSIVISDTDGDGLNDYIEVNGFTYGGQRWYTNPEAADSNGDGLGDLLEWGLNEDGSLRTTPLDTDGDGFPDLFDDDNDGDGVPDHKDLAPFTKGAAAYSEATPLQLTVNHLTAGQPTFVEFQLRPQDEQQLWYAFNVLDWPQDSEGQVRDVDGKTYADVALSAGRTPGANEANGDMKLEIRMADAGAQLPPQSDLTPFNIAVNDFTADGQTKVAHVPLSVVTDEKTGRRVAFSGQMHYLPDGNWSSAHQVRLVWVVQALVDLPCDPKDAAQVAQGCQPSGYIHNVPQMIQSYYSDWTLAGLSVREEHGTDMAIFYEDPTVDDNLLDDQAIWALAFVLEGQFVNPRDDNNDGRRDLTLADFPARFDRDNNPTEEQRFAVPNILQVETRSYATIDEAVASVTMTETASILNNVFKPHVENDRQIKPLLFFAQEYRSRQLGLDLAYRENEQSWHKS